MEPQYTGISPAFMALMNRGAEAYLDEVVMLRKQVAELKDQITKLNEMILQDSSRTVTQTDPPTIPTEPNAKIIEATSKVVNPHVAESMHATNSSAK